MHWAIWYYLYNLKNVKKTHGGVLILVTFSSNCSWKKTEGIEIKEKTGVTWFNLNPI